jgi:hypothetical protein
MGLDETRRTQERQMRTIRQRLVIGPLLAAAALAACSSGGGAVTAGAGTGGPVATAAPNATAAPVATATGGSAGAYCSLFSAAELQAFLGTDLGGGATDPAKPNSCGWSASDGTTLAIEKAPDEVVCEALKAVVMASGQNAFDGDYWAGHDTKQDVALAGATIGGTTCYDVHIAPAAKAPKPDALIAFVKQFVQKAGG